MMRFFSPALLAALAGAALPAAAATLKVPSSRYPTIQSAVSAARPGDTVLISAKPAGGVYNEAVTVSTPNLTLQGSNGPVLDGTGLGVLVPDPPFDPILVTPNGIEIRASHVAVRGLVLQNFGGSPLSAASAVNVGSLSSDGQTSYSFGDIEVSGCTLRGDYQGVTIAGYAGTSSFYGGGGAYLKGYKLLNNVITGATGYGASVSGVDVLASGNRITGSGGDGLDAAGDGLTVTGNEVGGTAYGIGVSVTCSTYNPAAGTKAAPTPDPTVVTLNSVHDNGSYGLSLSGTLLATGNTVDHNTDYGVYLNSASYSIVSGNAITRTTTVKFLSGHVSPDYGTGLYVANSGNTFGFVPGPGYVFTLGGPLTVALNRVSGNQADGIALDLADDVLVTGNAVTGNGQTGIHVSDFVLGSGLPGNVISYNYARQNALFDAEDDITAPDQDRQPTTPNVWANNAFGTTDPAGLSH